MTSKDVGAALQRQCYLLRDDALSRQLPDRRQFIQGWSMNKLDSPVFKSSPLTSIAKRRDSAARHVCDFLLTA
jgi:hypothetical protein